MEAGLCSVIEGGATAQVEQVKSLSSGVSWATESDCSLASRGRGECAVGPRIQLWEAGLVSQTLSQRRAMEEEGVRNFKELRARFQKFDAPLLPGPIKFLPGVSQKGKGGCEQSTKIVANGRPLSSNHNRPPTYCSSDESQSLKTQKMKLAQRSEIEKCSSSLGPPEKSTVCSAGNSQKASLPLDENQSNTEISCERKGMAANSFTDKLWNWEKVSSQKCEASPVLPLPNCGSKTFHQEGQKSRGLAPERSKKKPETTGAQTLPSQSHLMAQKKSLAVSEEPPSLLHHDRKSEENPSSERRLVGSPCQPLYECELASPASENQPDVRHHQLPKTKPLPSIESLGQPPPKPAKPPTVNLQAFQRQPAATSKTPKEVTVKENHLPPESADFEEPHNYEARISYLRHCGNPINLAPTEEIADLTYEVEIEELQKPLKSFLHQQLSPRHENEDKNMKEKEPCELEPEKAGKDPHSNHPLKVGDFAGTPGKIQMTRDHQDRRSILDEKQKVMTDIIQVKLCPEDRRLARYSQGQEGYVKALEVIKETPEPGALRSSSLSEEMYDDVESPRTDVPKLDLSSSLASDSEENSEEMYEDIYKTKSNHPKVDLDGKETLRRLQQFFKKEKDRFKMKKTKSKENVRPLSISLPDLEPKSQEVIIYDDVDMSEKEPKDEDKVKTWRPKFLIPKEKKEKKGTEGSASFSPRNFFRTKKQNLKKNRVEKEEKLFRERFQYDKEIIVINRAVACSNNSRNGIFDLPLTPGEELEVIDTTEQNLVICRNSKGKYGYVLIEHLHFKHQGWSR